MWGNGFYELCIRNFILFCVRVWFIFFWGFDPYLFLWGVWSAFFWAWLIFLKSPVAALQRVLSVVDKKVWVAAASQFRQNTDSHFTRKREGKSDKYKRSAIRKERSRQSKSMWSSFYLWRFGILRKHEASVQKSLLGFHRFFFKRRWQGQRVSLKKKREPLLEEIYEKKKYKTPAKQTTRSHRTVKWKQTYPKSSLSVKIKEKEGKKLNRYHTNISTRTDVRQSPKTLTWKCI